MPVKQCGVERRVDCLWLFFFSENRSAALMIFSGRHAIVFVKVSESPQAFLFALEAGLAAVASFNLNESFVSARMNAIDFGIVDGRCGDVSSGRGGGSVLRLSLRCDRCCIRLSL